MDRLPIDAFRYVGPLLADHPEPVSVDRIGRAFRGGSDNAWPPPRHVIIESLSRLEKFGLLERVGGRTYAIAHGQVDRVRDGLDSLTLRELRPSRPLMGVGNTHSVREDVDGIASLAWEQHQ